MIRIYFHKLAKNELFDARDYYDELWFGLGELFIDEINRCLKIIKINPLAYPVIKEDIRKAVVIKFPYSILYKVENEIIYVLAIMHQKRQPDYWINRI